LQLRCVFNILLINFRGILVHETGKMKYADVWCLELPLA
jgi:hypothetical protein